MRLTRRSRLRDVYAHPVGRDVIDKLLFATGLPSWVVTNPVTGALRLSTLDRLGRRFTGPGLVDTLLGIFNVEADVPSDGDGVTPPAWWKEAVFYQIYPRSFQDSNGDGIGDLAGIISRLDHLVDLGIDCVWLSPIFDSPNEDMGYDIRDYRAVMSEMGTLEDADALIAACHERGMRIIMDLVVNHTSVEHAWFQEALADPEGPKGAYYILREGSPDAVPNNWVSFFGGSAWRWFPEMERWALHLFAPGQMDLNWENPQVRDEVADVVRWWMDRGVDGFRLDVINYVSKQPGLPAGNDFIGRLMQFFGVEHYFYGPRLHEFMRELRKNGFTRRPGAVPPSGPADPVGVMVGEAPGIGVETGRLLTGAERGELDMVFIFDVLENPGHARFDSYDYDLNYLKRFYVDYLTRIGSSDWLALFLENHDNPRMISKVASDAGRLPAKRTAIGKLIATILLTLRGTPFLFQGQEIGAIDQTFTGPEDLRDVESVALLASLRDQGMSDVDAWTLIMGGTRDHARVPVRWDASPGGGFTTGTPWIEGRDDDDRFTVAAQRARPDSLLHWYRDLIALRHGHDAFSYGEIEFLAPDAANYFAWTRTAPDGERWLVEVNLANRPIRRRARDLSAEVVLASRGNTERTAMMAPYEATVSRVTG